MQPFTVQCPICQRRLVVRLQRLLGARVACPNCEAVLQIPTSEQLLKLQRNKESETDDATITQPQIIALSEQPFADLDSETKVADPSELFEKDLTDEIERLRQQAQEQQPVDADAQETIQVDPFGLSSSSDHKVPEGQQDEIPFEPLGESDALSPEFPFSETSGLDASPNPSVGTPIPDESWSSPESSRKRQFLLIGFVGAGGLAIAVGLFVLFVISSKSRQARDVANLPLQTLDSTQPPDSSQPAATASNDATTKSAESPPNANSSADSSETMLPHADGGLMEPENGSTSLSNGEPNDASLNSNGTSPGDTSPSGTAPGDSSEATTDSEVAEIDGANLNPFDINPNATEVETPAANDALSNNDASNGESETQSDSPSVPMDSFLQDLQSIFDPTGAGGMTDSGATDPIEDLPPILNIGERVHPAPIPPIDPQSVLSLTPPKMNATELSLANAVAFINGLHNSHFTVDLFGMTAANIPWESKVSLESDGKLSLGELMTASLSPLNLRSTSLPSGVIAIQPSEARTDESVPFSQEISDLIDMQRIGDWEAMLGKVFAEQAGIWKFQDNQIVFEPTSSAIARFEILAFLDRVRHASSLPTSRDYLNLSPEVHYRFQEAEAKLSRPLQSVIPQEWPLVEVLHTACRDAGFNVWFDWQNLLTHGFGPNQTGLILLHGRTIPQVVERTLDQYSLSLAVIDNQNLILTTPEAHRTTSTKLVVEADAEIDLLDLKADYAAFSPVDQFYQSQLRVERIPGTNLVVINACWPLVQQFDLLPRRSLLGTQ